MSNEPIRVRWYVSVNEEDEYTESAILVEVRKDQWGLYARVDDGEEGCSSKIVELWKLTSESYEVCKQLYPQLWETK